MAEWLRPAGAAALVLVCALPAAADWEATAWGMSQDEAVAATDGAAEPDGDAGLIMAWEEDGYTFVATLDFVDGGLARVDLVPVPPTGPTCLSLRNIARQRYGEAGDDPRDTAAVWADERHGNAVHVETVEGTDGEEGCALVYRPRGGAAVRPSTHEDEGHDR